MTESMLSILRESGAKFWMDVSTWKVLGNGWTSVVIVCVATGHRARHLVLSRRGKILVANMN